MNRRSFIALACSAALAVAFNLPDLKFDDGLFTGEIGRWYGVRIIAMTNDWKASIDYEL